MNSHWQNSYHGRTGTGHFSLEKYPPKMRKDARFGLPPGRLPPQKIARRCLMGFSNVQSISLKFPLNISSNLGKRGRHGWLIGRAGKTRFQIYKRFAVLTIYGQKINAKSLPVSMQKCFSDAAEGAEVLLNKHNLTADFSSINDVLDGCGISRIKRTICKRETEVETHG